MTKPVTWVMCNIIFVKWTMRGEKEKKNKRKSERKQKKHYCNLNITTKLLL